MSSQEFCLPDVGEGLQEAEIIGWKVEVGDAVTVNQTLVEIETEKSVVELPSPFDGVVTEILVAAGESAQVGAPIIRIGDGAASSDGGSVGTERAQGPDPAPEPEPEPDATPSVLVGYGPGGASTSRRRRRVTRQDTPAEQTPSTVSTKQTLAKPPVRKLAKDMGLDLRQITGTGDRGIITRSDVLAFSDGPETVDVSPVDDNVRERIPVSGVRKATAAAMRTSAFTAPHATEFVTVDVTKSMKLVEQLRADRAFEGTRATLMVVLARALMIAVRRYPEINASWQGEEIWVHDRVNLGIAAATPRGLLVPNIKDAGSLTLVELASALDELVATAREGRSSREQMTGGTITITNIGVFGVDSGTPILNPGEAAILCVGAVRRRPWEHKGEVALRSVVELSLSFDHRLVDGELGSRVLAHVARVLENPRWEMLLS